MERDFSQSACKFMKIMRHASGDVRFFLPIRLVFRRKDVILQPLGALQPCNLREDIATLQLVHAKLREDIAILQRGHAKLREDIAALQ